MLTAAIALGAVLLAFLVYRLVRFALFLASLASTALAVLGVVAWLWQQVEQRRGEPRHPA